MSVLFSDGFDSYAASADLRKKWLRAEFTWGATTGRYGGGGLSMAAGSLGAASVMQTDMRMFPAVGSAQVVFGFHIKLSAIPSAEINLFRMTITDSSVRGVLNVMNSTGAVRLYGLSNAIINTGTTNICDNNWHWIEGRVNTANSSQTQTIMVDSTQEFATAANFGQNFGQFATGCYFIGNNSGTSINGLDDFILIDNNGDSPKPADFPLGVTNIASAYASGDGTVQLTRSSGSNNYALINEVNADGDTSFVESATANQKDFYDFPDITFQPAQFWGVNANAYVEMTSDGTRNWRANATSGGSTINGTSQAMVGDYFIQQQWFGLNPNGSVAWTQAGYNAAQFGPEVV